MTNNEGSRYLLDSLLSRVLDRLLSDIGCFGQPSFRYRAFWTAFSPISGVLDNLLSDIGPAKHPISGLLRRGEEGA